MTTQTKCRICGRAFKPHGASRPSATDPTACQNCADLMWAIHGKRPIPPKEVHA